MKTFWGRPRKTWTRARRHWRGCPDISPPLQTPQTASFGLESFLKLWVDER